MSPPSQKWRTPDKAIDGRPARRFNRAMTCAATFYYWFTTSHTGGAQGSV
jgi:hypothetical protein